MEVPMRGLLARFLNDESGLETIEYAILAFICVNVAVLGYSTLAGAISTKFTGIAHDPTMR
jgi:Flp pilus assembly pilin Flp